jgi:hypothetical protein
MYYYKCTRDFYESSLKAEIFSKDSRVPVSRIIAIMPIQNIIISNYFTRKDFQRNKIRCRFKVIRNMLRHISQLEILAIRKVFPCI